MLEKILLLTVLVSALTLDNQHHASAQDEDRPWMPPAIDKGNPEFWKHFAYEQRNKDINIKQAKNIILFVGAGMSSSTIKEARIAKGQKMGTTGEEKMLSFEKFPYTGWSKTQCLDSTDSDSACSSTALMCGLKSNILTIGVNADVRYNNCTESMNPKNHVSSILQWAQEAGKSTGFVTTGEVTDAIPSALYAHVANRYYENDVDVRSEGWDPTECVDIATQLITQEPGKYIDVIMGGGLSKFLDNQIIDVHGKKGTREDNKYLLQDWQNMHPQGSIVTNRMDLLNLKTSEVSHVMGVFQTDDMDYHLHADPSKQPTLAEMTETALKLLKRNDKGYFIVIAGGIIDTAFTKNTTLGIDEVLEFEKAIQLARDATDSDDTLIVVTSDRANDFASSYSFDDNTEENSELDLPSLDDVPIYASGPLANLFSRVMEESTITHLMAYAACIGNRRDIFRKLNKIIIYDHNMCSRMIN